MVKFNYLKYDLNKGVLVEIYIGIYNKIIHGDKDIHFNRFTQAVKKKV